MQHVATPDTDITAQAGCYNCRRAEDGVIFDNSVEGEGLLFLCSACIKDATKHVTAGRLRMEREAKRQARLAAAQT